MEVGVLGIVLAVGNVLVFWILVLEIIGRREGNLLVSWRRQLKQIFLGLVPIGGLVVISRYDLLFISVLLGIVFAVIDWRLTD